MTIPSQKRTSALIVLLLILGTVAVFWKVPAADFVQWDDDINIYRNPYHGGLSWERFVWMFTDLHYVLYYAPLSWLTLSIIYEFSGLNPVGYHLASLLLHCANAVLLYFTIRTFAKRHDPNRGMNETALAICAGLGALIWAIHPLRVEAVAWATGISYLLATFFTLVSLLCYLKSQSEAGNGRRPFFVLSVLAFFAGIISYPMVMAFPLVLVIIDILVIRRFSGWAGGPLSRPAVMVWIEKIPFFAISAAVLGFTLYRRSQAAGLWAAPVSLQDFGIAQRAVQAFYVWAYYLWKPFVPWVPAYSNLVNVNPTEPRFILSCLIVVGITSFLFWKRQRFPGLLALWLSYLCLLVPLLGLTEHPHYTSDRYCYFVAGTTSVLIAIGLLSLWKTAGLRWLSLTVLMLIAVAGGILSFKQTSIWKNTASLFGYWLKTADSDGARAAIRWRLGVYHRNMRQLTEAQKQLELAARLAPRSVPVHTELGTILSMRGNFENALREFGMATNLGPAFVEAHIGIASLLFSTGRTSEAVEEYQRALRLRPNSPEALDGLGWVRSTAPEPNLRQADEALAAASRACELTGFSNPKFVLTLAAAYAENGEFDAAVRTAQQAAELASAQHDTEQEQFSRQLEASFRNRKPFRIDHKAAKPSTDREPSSSAQ